MGKKIEYDTAMAWTQYVTDSPQEHLATQPARHEVVIERGLRIPMRDGTQLSAVLWRPDTAGPFPTLVERGPHRLEERTGPAGEYHAARGYAVLSVGLRGCAGSEGTFTGTIPGSPTGDGYDTIEWITRQPWCNGRIGMICGSISGLTQYQTAVEAPPSLTALLVREGPFQLPNSPQLGLPLLALQFVTIAWTEHRLAHISPELQDKAQALVKCWQQEWQQAQAALATDSPFLPVPAMLNRLPLYPNPEFAEIADFYDGHLVPPTEGGLPSTTLAEEANQVSIPICHLGGWFDGLLPDVLTAFTAFKEHAQSTAVRQKQRLIIGPWVHGPAATTGQAVGLLEFGPNATLDFLALRQRWYDAMLQDTGNVSDDPTVWLYLTGPDRWLAFADWPPPATPTHWYLHGTTLIASPPTDAESPDSYEYDPMNPVPTLAGGGAFGIGLDQRPVEDRLLAYTSEPLAAPLTLVGPVQAILHAASSAPDTDWVVRLTMVRPDGASVILSGGVLTARYRHAVDEPALLEANQPERFVINMMPISIEIPAGYCLRLTVTSSDFPAYARNLNTGQAIAKASKGQVAINQIFHDSLHPSHVVLPVLA
ncbi:MAG: CocE/NonD family hydrolase [Caldilineaceae bacterium]